MDLIAVLCGFGVGALVGTTGVGGGSLMTPLLLSVFRIAPAVAIGTDLWFAALTKSTGALSHHRADQVRWRVAGLLLAGSLPASIATLAAMLGSSFRSQWSDRLALVLAIALFIAAAVVALRHVWQRVGLRLEERLAPAWKAPLTVLCGVVLGVLVSLTSIGAGAIGAAMIALLHPRLDPRQLIGTEIAHAVPVTLTAGIGHALLGHVDLALLGSLLVGSLPGIWLGAQLTRRLPERAVRALLSISLVGAGWRVIS